MKIDWRQLEEAMTSGPQWGVGFLDAHTGAIMVAPPEDSDLDDDMLEAFADIEELLGDSERYHEVPVVEGRDLVRWMGELAAAEPEGAVRRELEAALDGRDAIRRFRRALEELPEVRARWRALERERTLEVARDWLEGIGVEATLEHLPDVHAPGPEPDHERERIRLWHVLACGGKTELLSGRVHKSILARDAKLADGLFRQMVRDICELHGIAYRRRLIEGRRFELEKWRVERHDNLVDVSLAMPLEIFLAFGD